MKIKQLPIIFLLIIFSLLVSACGNKETEKAKSAAETEVSNVDEMIAAIRPGASIVLKSGEYNLTKASTYGNNTHNEYCFWDKINDREYQLVIRSTDNLSFTGDNSSIVTEPRCAHVFCFENCNNLSIKSLSIGHTKQAEACEGAVLFVDTCENVKISYCALYGCGVTGIYSNASNNMTVENTDIFHCSSSGISFSNAHVLNADSCNFYDCGSENDAFCIFDFNYASDINISKSSIHNNNSQYLIMANEVKNVSFNAINIFNNRFDIAFSYSGDLKLTNAVFSSNVINKWFPSGGSSKSSIIIDNVPFSENELAQKYPGQVSSEGIGFTEVEKESVILDGKNEVHVKTADEFLKALKSDATIVLDAEIIDLTSASDYGKDASDEEYYGVNPAQFNGKNYYWSKRYDGFALCIGNLNNLSITGPGEIITQPRYADVLTFYNCTNLLLNELKLGHSPESGACAGGVVYLLNCRDILINGCDLYGCGIYGIQSDSIERLKVQNTLIHDCSYGAVSMTDSDDVSFIECKIQYCPSPHFTLSDCKNFSWNNKIMNPDSNFDVEN